jgi:hypothetical protein
MMGQVVYGGSKFLQILPYFFKLSMKCFWQVVAPVVILEHRSNLFVLRSSGDAM